MKNEKKELIKTLVKITKSQVTLSRGLFLSFDFTIEIEDGGGFRFCDMILHNGKKFSGSDNTCFGAKVLTDLMIAFDVENFNDIEGEYCWLLTNEKPYIGSGTVSTKGFISMKGSGNKKVLFDEIYKLTNKG